MKCPKCSNRNIIKNGFSKGVQRYKCKDCNRSFILKQTPEQIIEKIIFEDIDNEIPDEILDDQFLSKWINTFEKKMNPVQKKSGSIIINNRDNNALILFGK